MKKTFRFLILCILIILMTGCSISSSNDNKLRVPAASYEYKGKNYQEVINDLQKAGFTNIETNVLYDLITGWLTKDGEVDQIEIEGDTTFRKNDTYPKDAKIVITYHTFPIREEEKTAEIPDLKVDDDDKVNTEDIFEGYTLLEVDGGDLSGNRQPNVVVDIGYGDREYYAFTNEYGQLVKVIAARIILQDHDTEPVTADGRYYHGEAKVPGTEGDDLDRGHVIADSLGGVSNAYNITPQNSVLNQHGNQAYMERAIRDAGGCEDFLAIFTYPDNETQIPSHYHYEYVLNGEKIVEDFDNVNPDEVNAAIIQNESEELAKVDTDGNGKVTIAEAKAAGYSMPIYSDHWLYKYMNDRDGDGVVGE